MFGVIWGTLWRMVLRGLGMGLGAAYGAVAAPLGMLVSAVDHEATRRIEVTLWAIPLGMVVVIAFGIVVGAALGALAGPVLGALCWVVPLVLARIRISRPGETYPDRETAGWAFAAATVVAIFAAWAASGFDSNALLLAEVSVGLFDGGIADAALLRVAPALLAGWAARSAGRKMFDRWGRRV